MNRTNVSSLLLVFALAASACGSSDDGGDEAAEATTATTAAEEATTTTVEETTTSTTEAPTTTAEETTTTTEATTTTEPPVEVPEPPPAGTGILTVDGEEFPFTIDKCVTEPAPGPTETSMLLFEMRGSTVVEGENAEARLFRLASNGLPPSDSFGWGYALDPNDFETIRSEGPPFGIGEHIIVEETDAGITFYAPPIQFERSEGISVVEEDAGLGSIIATC